MTAVSASFLYPLWQQLSSELSKDTALADNLFADLCKHYAEPQRYYHHLAHIVSVWQLIQPYYPLLAHLSAVQWAVLYHDAIYDTTRSDNEQQSGIYAQQHIARLGGGQWLQQRVYDLIVATQTHIAAPHDNDMQYLLDADLAILGSSAEQYEQYYRAIRREYAWVADEIYRQGRQVVLTQLLNKQPIYYTDDFSKQYGLSAKRNIMAEIAYLKTTKTTDD